MINNLSEQIDETIKTRYKELLHKIMWKKPRIGKRKERFVHSDKEIKDTDEGGCSRAYLILTTWGINNWGSEHIPFGGGAWVMGDLNTKSNQETCPSNPKPFYRRLFDGSKGNIIPIYEEEPLGEEPKAGNEAGYEAGGGGKKKSRKKKSRKKKSKKKKTKKKKSRKNKSRKNKKK